MLMAFAYKGSVIQKYLRGAGRFLARAAMQQLQDPEMPLMKHLEIPTDEPE
jgi:hypothetical protein